MAAQLTCDPIIKITLTDGQLLNDYAPGLVLESFKLFKELLTPNKFEFYLRRDELTLDTPDIEFELRDKLLTAKVEVTLKARYYNVYDKEWVEYDVEDFFYGYIQNIKIFRVHSENLRFRCIAYSPDARLKSHPTCNVYNDIPLKECVEDILSQVIEPMTTFDSKKGAYDKDEPLNADIHPLSNSVDEEIVMRYTVQYNESNYDFLKRLARRYAEFMYYENREFVFGKMKELPEVLLHNGTDLEEYRLEMNMNDHTSVGLFDWDPIFFKGQAYGIEKKAVRDEADFENYQYDGGVNLEKYDNPMSQSAYTLAPNFYANNRSMVYDMGARVYNDGTEQTNFDWLYEQRQYLERYVLSDSLICTGKSNHVDLKIGTQITIEDDTYTGAENEESVNQRPMIVIGVSYTWNIEENLQVTNIFKAIPHDAQVPPYLERDKDGFLVYGNFDLYPQSGPQLGFVMDDQDPDHLGRVKVLFQWQLIYAAANTNSKTPVDIAELTPWIKVASPYQGHHRGSLVIPERFEQVLVGFEYNNLERPYVIGSLYKKDEMPSEWSQYDKNRVKGFRSRSGHCIEFIDNEDTDSGTSKGGKIHIYDAKTHAYDIVFDTDKQLISMESKGNIELTANNNIVLHAKNNIDLTADNDMNINVKNDLLTNVKHDYAIEVENDLTEVVKRNVYTETNGEEEHHAVGEIWTHSDDLVYLQGANEVYMEASETNLFYANDVNIGVYAKCSDGDYSTSKSEFQINASHMVMHTQDNLVLWITNEVKNVKIDANQDVEISAFGNLNSSSLGQTKISGNPVKIN